MSNQPEEAPKAATSEAPQHFQRVAPAVPYYSIVLIVSLAAVAAVQILVDGPDSILFGGERSTLLAGFWKPVFLDGQYWRILTGASLHGGLIHLAFIGAALYVLGKLIETLSNRAHLAIVFLLSAIGGNILSLIFLPDGNSVGASGGIVGFLGYLTVYGYRRREILTSAFLKNMLFNIAFMVFIGISINQSRDGGLKIDNFGHLGGLLTGAIYGFFQISGDVYKDPRVIGKATEIVGLAALGTFIAVCGFSVLLLLRIV
jgi:membrane associated rhomboid family serine protease